MSYSVNFTYNDFQHCEQHVTQVNMYTGNSHLMAAYFINNDGVTLLNTQSAWSHLSRRRSPAFQGLNHGQTLSSPGSWTKNKVINKLTNKNHNNSFISFSTMDKLHQHFYQPALMSMRMSHFNIRNKYFQSHITLLQQIYLKPHNSPATNIFEAT